MRGHVNDGIGGSSVDIVRITTADFDGSERGFGGIQIVIIIMNNYVPGERDCRQIGATARSRNGCYNH